MINCKVCCLVHMDISHPQAKILDTQGYNERIKVPCYQNPGSEVDTDNEANTMDSIVSCNNEHLFERTISQTPCIFCISCDPKSDKGPFQPTGVDSLSSLQQNILTRGVDYFLGAMILQMATISAVNLLILFLMRTSMFSMMVLQEAIIIQISFLLQVHTNRLWESLTSVNFGT